MKLRLTVKSVDLENRIDDENGSPLYTSTVIFRVSSELGTFDLPVHVPDSDDKGLLSIDDAVAAARQVVASFGKSLATEASRAQPIGIYALSPSRDRQV